MRFLTAEWRNLVMVNYEIAPEILSPFVPVGTELDLHEGKCYISLVAFMFMNTKLLGLKIPFHINFEEVNLRFYVKRKHEGKWRRGVVFIKEIVPKMAIASVANWVYRENYVAKPMRHKVTFASDKPQNLEYQWRHDGKWNRIFFEAAGQFHPIKEGSHVEFITEHYFGYTAWSKLSSLEYEVEHPRWKYARSANTVVECDFASLYGPQFKDTFDALPVSSFLCDGSAIIVNKGLQIS